MVGSTRRRRRRRKPKKDCEEVGIRMRTWPLLRIWWFTHPSIQPFIHCINLPCLSVFVVVVVVGSSLSWPSSTIAGSLIKLVVSQCFIYFTFSLVVLLDLPIIVILVVASDICCCLICS